MQTEPTEPIVPSGVDPRITASPTEPILRYFEYGHLPEHLQSVSHPFYHLAHVVLMALPRNAERTVALRKLLECKDAAVRAALTIVLVLLCAVAGQAQTVPIPISYQVTRLLPLPVATANVLRANMSCDQPVGPIVAAVGFRLTDPTSTAPNLRDCEFAGNPGGNVFQPRVAGVAYHYTVAGCIGTGECGPAADFTNISLPSAPVNPRVKPGNAAGVQVEGLIFQRIPFLVGTGPVEVISTRVGGELLHLGAYSFTLPGYSVQPGDWVSVTLCRAVECRP